MSRLRRIARPDRERRTPREPGRLARVRDDLRGRWAAAAPRREPVARVLRCVSPLGWAVLGIGLACWIGAAILGWLELAYAAIALVLLFLLSCLLTLGRTRLDVSLKIAPRRVTAGEVAVAEVRLRNTGSGRLLPLPLELPCGDTSTRFLVPPLPAGHDHDDIVVLPTGRRGVYRIGPVTTLRGDPFGLVRRTIAWTDAVDLVVHPVTTYLGAFGTGLLRDLDGQTTSDPSPSDLAFHGLREYVPGDDQRHIHWASTAKRTSVSGSMSFMVRQFLDTRRTHIGVVLDCDEAAYAGDDEFELAVSVAASLARRAVADQIDLSEAAGTAYLPGAAGAAALDLFARTQLVRERVDVVAANLARRSPGISMAVVVSGSRAPLELLARAAAALPSGVTALVIRVEPGADLARRAANGRVVVTVGALADLPRALASGVRA